MYKIIFGNLLRHGLTLLIAFLAAKKVLGEDVAAKLYAGDTVELWDGAIKVSVSQIVNFLMLSVIPLLIPVWLAFLTNVKEKYKTIIARQAPNTLSKEEVKTEAAAASTIEKIKAVNEESKK